MKTDPVAKLIARHLKRKGQEVRPDRIILERVTEENGLVTIIAIINDTDRFQPVFLKFRVDDPEEWKGK